MEFTIKKDWLETIEKRIDNALPVVGAFLVSRASDNLRADRSVLSGNLINSLGYATEKVQTNPRTGKPMRNPGKLKVRVGSSLVYALQHEMGGTIKPRQAGALAIPVHADAKKAAQLGQGPRDIPDLVLIARPGRPALLVRVIGNGRRQRFDIMYVLVSSVTQKAKPFLRPALESNVDDIIKIIGEHNNG